MWDSMRVVSTGLFFWIAAISATSAQQFNSPLDLVETLYGSYFDGVAIDDLSPYLSNDLTRQMDGSVGVSQFQALGFDPIVSDPNWSPRGFQAVTVQQTEENSQVQVDFETSGVPVSIKITLVREPVHGWQIDHLAGSAGGRTWCTNDIIALSPVRVNSGD